MPPDFFTTDAFLRHLCEILPTLLENKRSPVAFFDLLPDLAMRFPKGSRVKACGLSKAELNGIIGEVAGRFDQEKLRVGVNFPEPHGLLSIKATCLGPEVSYSEWAHS